MKVSTQLLVVVGLGGLVLAVGAFEAGKLEKEPEIIRRAREQSQMPPWSGGAARADEPGDGEEGQVGSDADPDLFERLSRAITSWTESEDDLSGDALPYRDLDSIFRQRVPQFLLKKGPATVHGQARE